MVAKSPAMRRTDFRFGDLHGVSVFGARAVSGPRLLHGRNSPVGLSLTRSLPKLPLELAISEAVSRHKECW